MTSDRHPSVFISVDLEGIACVVTDRQVTRGHSDYADACRLMTLEANAAVEGAFAGGASRVVVSDSHADMSNLILDLLDPRAEIVQGTPKLPLSMMTGIDASFDCAFFVGYHAQAGTASAVMDHTFHTEILDARVNGQSWGESGFNAALAGQLGVPVTLVTGDTACCAEARSLLPWTQTVAVKSGGGRFVASSLSPQTARARIHAAAEDAVRIEGPLFLPPPPPIVVEVDVARSVLAELLSLVPSAERIGARSVRLQTLDYVEAYRCLIAWGHLAGSLKAA